MTVNTNKIVALEKIAGDVGAFDISIVCESAWAFHYDSFRADLLSKITPDPRFSNWQLIFFFYKEKNN